MTNPNGTRFETACVRYAMSRGFRAYRIARSGRNDKGDIQLTEDVILECKATRAIQLAEAMEQLKVEVKNADARYGAAVIKRRQRGVDRSYAVMEYDDFLSLVAEANGGKS